MTTPTGGEHRLEDHPDANALGERIVELALATPMADAHDRVHGAFAALIALAFINGWTPEKLSDFCVRSVAATVKGMPPAFIEMLRSLRKEST